MMMDKCNIVIDSSLVKSKNVSLVVAYVHCYLQLFLGEAAEMGQ